MNISMVIAGFIVLAISAHPFFFLDLDDWNPRSGSFWLNTITFMGIFYVGYSLVNFGSTGMSPWVRFPLLVSAVALPYILNRTGLNIQERRRRNKDVDDLVAYAEQRRRTSKHLMGTDTDKTETQ
jgi:hypothetical protein